MNRKPETKKAAQLITAAFAAQGVKFGHQAALNLLATLEGYESFAQMKAAQADTKQQTASKTESREFIAHILFGEDECRAFRDIGDSDALAEALEPAKSYRFPTIELANAFLDGVEEATGWLEYKNVSSVVRARDSVLESGVDAAEQSSRLAVLRDTLALHGLPCDDVVSGLEPM